MHGSGLIMSKDSDCINDTYLMPLVVSGFLSDLHLEHIARTAIDTCNYQGNNSQQLTVNPFKQLFQMYTLCF